MKSPNAPHRLAKYPVDRTRIRTRPRQFACLDRALVYEKHICLLRLAELALYVFLECVSDPQGLSYYSDQRLCQYLHLAPDQLRQARAGLVAKQFVLYACPMYQLLNLPPGPPSPPIPCAQAPASLPKPSSGEPVALSTVLDSILEEFTHAHA
jgi:hypothetical protein